MESTLRNLGGIEPTPNSDSKMEEHPSKQPLLPKLPFRNGKFVTHPFSSNNHKGPQLFFINCTWVRFDLVSSPPQRKKFVLHFLCHPAPKTTKTPPGPAIFRWLFFLAPGIIGSTLGFFCENFPPDSSTSMKLKEEGSGEVWFQGGFGNLFSMSIVDQPTNKNIMVF